MSNAYKIFIIIFFLASFIVETNSAQATLDFVQYPTVVINDVTYTIQAGSQATSMTSISDGTVVSSQKIADNTGGFGTLVNGDLFGLSVTSIGDLNSDGITDLAVGAPSDDTGGNSRGAIYILFMNADGTVASTQKIASGTNGLGTLTNGDQFGESVASIGDLDNDGITDLAVGANSDDTGGTNRGAVYILFMGVDGTVSSSQKIADSTGGLGTLLNDGYFGTSISSIGDLNSDGVSELAVGAWGDSTGGSFRGALYILFMNTNGTVASSQKIADSTGGLGALTDFATLGFSVSSIGDLNSDGVSDLAVGGAYSNTGGTNRGNVYIFFMNTDGTVASLQNIASGIGGLGALADSDYFGIYVASLGDLDNDGITDLAVGANGDDTGGSNRGALYILYLNVDGTVSSSQKIADNTGGFGTLVNGNQFGSSVASIGDFNGDGVSELAVGAQADATGGSSRGALYILFMTRTSSSDLTVTVPNGADFTLVSPQRHTFNNDGNVNPICTYDQSSITVSNATVTITPSATTCIPNRSSSGSSSRGSSRTTAKVANPSTLDSLASETPSTPTSSSSITYNFGITTLKKGSSGLTVQSLQTFLNTQNFTLVVDGKFGPLTTAAVKQWQQANGLVPDGFVGPLTKVRIDEIVR